MSDNRPSNYILDPKDKTLVEVVAMLDENFNYENRNNLYHTRIKNCFDANAFEYDKACLELGRMFFSDIQAYAKENTKEDWMNEDCLEDLEETEANCMAAGR